MVSLSHRPFFRRFFAALFLLVMVFALVPRTSFAFSADGPTILDRVPAAGYPTMDVGQKVDAAYQNIRYELLGAGTIALMNAAQVFFGQLAYDFANYLASGGKGQGALFYKKGFDGYLKDVSGSALGEFIGSLSQGEGLAGSNNFFRGLGLDLCAPNPSSLLRIQLSLGGMFPNPGQGRFQRPRPRCEFNDIVQNYDRLYTSMSNGDVLKNLEANLNTNANDLGVAFSIFGRSEEFMLNRRNAAQQDRQEGGGFLGISSIISGNVRTPAETIREQTNNQLVRAPQQQQLAMTTSLLENAWNLGPIRLATYTASIFLNTLTNRLLQRVMEDGIGVFDFLFQNGGGNVSDPDDIAEGDKKDVRQANIGIRTPMLFKNEAYDVLSEMQACPPENRGTWNCTLDEGLSLAVRIKDGLGGVTILDALERGYLHQDWPLLPASSYEDERDPLCYSRAYCTGNLRKLRAMRILPVGFEFAANSQENIERCASTRGCITLGDVVKEFQNCNAQGERDGAHPWCKLIDPNWVIALPQQQCALNGYGETFLAGSIPQRRQECQDIQTCLQRNDRGECVGGYGYCVAEKTVYRFGAQECKPRNASCRTYQNPAGETVSYLRNTLDYSACTQDNVGCRWYATERSVSGVADAWEGTVTVGPRQYMDNSFQECPADQDGCTKLLEVKSGVAGLNIIENSSFERTTQNGARLTGWLPYAGGNDAFVPPRGEGSLSIDGQSSASFAGGFSGGYLQTIALEPNRTYVVSAFVRAQATNGARVTVGVRQFDNASPADGNVLSGTDVARDFVSRECVYDAESRALVIRAGTNLDGQGTNWKRIECAFTTNAQTHSGQLVITNGRDALVDAVQIEEGSTAGTWIDGANTSLAAVHLKLPPTELRCTGAANDPAICGQYAKVCRQTEAGCDGFTDKSGIFPEVAAQMTAGDACPSACVGYAEFRKLPSSFDLVRNAIADVNDPEDATSTYFIPATAEACSEENVGCEAFTALSASSSEQVSYFKAVRYCEQPGNDTETYFTWEGSESTGYQLRTWSLKKRTPEKPGVTPPEGAEVGTSAGPRVVITGSSDLSAQRDPLACNESAWRAQTDADCRQFYDSTGVVYYRFYSQTVISSDACQAYRIARSNNADCTKTGGSWNAQTASCTYNVLASESRTCSQEFAGCRAYAGAEAGNIQTTLNASFRSNQESGFTGGRISTEALSVNDGSYRVDVAARSTGSVGVSPTGDANGLYRVNFWAKASAPTAVTFRRGAADGDVIATAALTTDWRQYTFGLFKGEAGQMRLSWNFAADQVGSAVFIDEVLIQKMQDVVYVKQGTWNTPAVCDQNAYSVPEPQAMLGCRLYRKRSGEEVAVRQFTRLCRQDVIGCKAFIDTRNSDSAYKQTFVVGTGADTVTTTRRADHVVYVIDEPGKRCKSENASCRAFGKPVFSADHATIQRFETVYFKDDINVYPQGLCRASELFCQEFAASAGKEYFKDPEGKTCEYRENVTVSGVIGVSGGQYSGWFQTDTSIPCYPNALTSGSSFSILRTGDALPAPGYSGWVGSCEEQEAECTEFRDPNDRSSDFTTGRSYFFLRNNQIDTTSCAGTVDPSKGCVLLRDMSSAQPLYNTNASYAAFQANRLNPVQPVNCQTDPTNQHCRQGAIVGRCQIETRTLRRRVERVGTDFVNDVPTRFIDQIVETSQTATTTGGVCTFDRDCEAPVSSVGPDVVYVDRNGRNVLTPSFESRSVASCIPGEVNDANIIAKVTLDRDCAQWLGCSSGETVFDPATGRYREICTNTAMCDRLGANGGEQFCANYVSRSTTTTEPVLTKGAYFDASRYASRQVGLGRKDYSGFAVPGAFQVADLRNAKMADLIGSADTGLGKEARMVVAVRMPPVRRTRGSVNQFEQVIRTTQPNEAMVLANDDPLRAAFPGYRLCRHVGTGRIGFFSPVEAQNSDTTGQSLNCYLSFRGASEAYDFQRLAQAESREGGVGQNDILDQAFPGAICRAYPEPNSPYAKETVLKWDMSKNPIAPEQKATGYERVNTCEYGEDCLCTYKRATFETATKFYGPNSQAIPTGLCVGGPRAGQACLPGEIFSINAATASTTNERAARVTEGANLAQSCGPVEAGGRCVAASDISIVRGIYGNCLEPDTTRARGALGQESYPCLTWNPTPVMFGDKDPYHYVPTAGYFPPQNAGQYYCVSPARGAKNLYLDASVFPILPTGMTAMSYSDWTVSDGSAAATTGDDAGAYFYGMKPEGSNAAKQCEDADDIQDDDLYNNDRDSIGLRLIQTGRTTDSSYTETFYGVDATKFANWLYGATTDRAKAKATQDYNFSYFEFQPIKNRNGKGRLACAYQEDWVEGVRVDDYADEDKIIAADRQWQQNFSSEPDRQPYLTRGSESMLVDATGKPMALSCETSGLGTNEFAPGTSCYFKYWEGGYRASGKEAFVGFNPREGGYRSFKDMVVTPYMKECSADRPYYSIRAVFQTSADRSVQNFPVSDASAARISAIRGPWRFIGFWVSACAGKSTNDNRFIYTTIRVQNADVCKELAEVRSIASNQDAAFTDRVWKDGKYVVPDLNIEYNQTFAPFSSALNTGPAGQDPLYQVGGRLAGFSPLRPPVFLGAGYSTYFSAAREAPVRSYAYLTNLFARIYRIYRYNEQKIDVQDYICSGGPNKGRKCVPGNPPQPSGRILPGPSEDCRVTDMVECRTNITATERRGLQSQKICNALSGVNAGRSCIGRIPEAQESCHLYALNPRNSQPLRTSCNVVEGWTQRDGGWVFRARGGIDGIAEPVTQEEAYGMGAFRCAPGAVKDGSREDAPTVACSAPTNGAPSRECPLEVRGECRGAGTQEILGISVTVPGTCFGTWQGQTTPVAFPDAAPCMTNNDCSFNQNHFWLLRPYSPRLISRQEALMVNGSNRMCYNLMDRLANPFSAYEPGSSVGSPVVPGGHSYSYAQLGSDCDSLLNPCAARLRGMCLESPINTTGWNTLLPRMGGSSGYVGYDPSARFPGIAPGRDVIGACESVTDLLPALADPASGPSLGVCTGGTRMGQTCASIPDSVTLSRPGWMGASIGCPAATTASGSDDQCAPVSDFAPSTRPGTPDRYTPTRECLKPGARANQTKEEYWDGLVPSPVLEARNLNTDNNTCTQEVGYVTDAETCPDPTNEYCGLLTYQLRSRGTGAGARPIANSIDGAINQKLPTDVTLGYYTPAFLGLQGGTPTKYAYMDYYTPRPPRIAAPDTSRCTGSGNCSIASFDRFTFNGVTEGVLNVQAGQQRSTIKFYGWAADNQMAIRQMAVDWGDGFVQSFDDVKLKNRKPFCSVQKECYSPSEGFTGLTCTADTDCPVTAQACRPKGTCKDNAAILCSQDSDCRRGGGEDTCEVRTFFGSSAEACEATYFDFSHVYTCNQNAASQLPRCSNRNPLNVDPGRELVVPSNVRAGTCFFGEFDSIAMEAERDRPSCQNVSECQRYFTTRYPEAASANTSNFSCGPISQTREYTLPGPTQARCSGDASRVCTDDTDCAAGDRCVSGGLAPPGGCFDETAGVCRYTPRVLIRDNWGWCTGECRSVRLGGALADPNDALIVHPYGGCYSAVPLGSVKPYEQATRLNTDGNVSSFVPDRENNYDECSVAAPSGRFTSAKSGSTPLQAQSTRNNRPWIVFPGSIQLRPRN